jgi:hypothetical protein
MQTNTPHSVPLLISGNITAFQEQMLNNLLQEIVTEAYESVLEQLDKQSAQAVLDNQRKLKEQLVSQVAESIRLHTASNKFHDEAVGSDRVYPPTYRIKSIEAQVTELRKAYPQLQSCNEKLARRPLPDGAEGWFAIPRWQAIAPTYNQAALSIVNKIGERRRFSNRIFERMSEKYLRNSERATIAQRILCEQQGDADILVVAAQFGMLHRGSSARRTRAVLAGNEYGLGAFAIASMLLTHPERLSTAATLMIDCSGDEYSAHGDYTFDRVPLFDYDISGVEFSIFYEDRARNLWGTPTAFLFKQV